MCPDTGVGIGPSPLELSPPVAFRILPIAHQYELQTVLRWCQQAAQRQTLPLWPPSSTQPVALDTVPHQPGLVQWLALAEQRHCDELIGSCVTQLTAFNGDFMRQALVSRHLGPMVDGLSSETKSDLLWNMSGLPLSIKVG